MPLRYTTFYQKWQILKTNCENVYADFFGIELHLLNCFYFCSLFNLCHNFFCYSLSAFLMFGLCMGCMSYVWSSLGCMSFVSVTYRYIGPIVSDIFLSWSQFFLFLTFLVFKRSLNVNQMLVGY